MIDVIFENQQGFERVLGALGEGLSDWTIPTQKGLQILADSVLENITEQGRPPYPDILAATRTNRRFDSTTPPLWDSGALADAATATRPGVDGSVFGILPDGLGGQIGVQGDFHGAARHQFGYTGPDSLGRTFNEPARAFMLMQDQDRVAIIEVFDAYMAQLIGSQDK